MGEQTLDDRQRSALLAPLTPVDAQLAALYPGGVPAQPAHTCYVPADRMRAREAEHWGETALQLLHEHAPDAPTLADALRRPVSEECWQDVRRLLTERPVHDLRVDLEDGYGRRSDDEEDAAVDAALDALAAAPPPSYGVRFKALEVATAQRAARTLDRWLTGLAARGLAPGIVTLPKVQSPPSRSRSRSSSSPCWRRGPAWPGSRSSSRSRRQPPSSMQPDG